jgi:hypothetical protein
MTDEGCSSSFEKGEVLGNKKKLAGTEEFCKLLRIA